MGTRHALILSLGPIPLCVFRQEIAYTDIASINVIRGRCHVLQAIWQHIVTWQPLAFAYGLALGPAAVDLAIEPSGPCDTLKGCCWLKALLLGTPIQKTASSDAYLSMLVSTSDADALVAQVRFRQVHGPLAVLPESLLDHDTRWKCRLWQVLRTWLA